jgi:hypothetical protein
MNEEKPSLLAETAPKTCGCAGNNPKKTGCCAVKADRPTEINGFEAQGLLEPTRYGDWDVKGRCSDF